MHAASSIVEETRKRLAPRTSRRPDSWRLLAWQGALLALVAVLVPLLPLMPRELSGLHQFGPFIALTIAGAISLSFNRGRVTIAVAALATACAIQGRAALGSSVDFAVVGAVTLLVVATMSLLRERGTFNRHALRRFVAAGTAFAAVAWLIGSGTWAQWRDTMPVVRIAGLEMSLLAVGAMAIAVGMSMAAFGSRRTAIDAAFVASVLAFGSAGLLVSVPHASGFLVAAAAACLTVGVLQDAYRLAFVDELTGLGGRRALNEKLLTLGDRFTIAMVDVDHFKGVNDRFGHDTGDQVLRMIASHIERTGGGARAYRYGGEEFAIVFPGKSAREAIPHLEQLRADVERYRMQLRADEIPAKGAAVDDSRGARQLRVTVSIGVAERDGRHGDPAAVLLTADQALYRAKDRGRNRLSR